MDNEQYGLRGAQSGQRAPMTTSSPSGSARRAARSKGLAWVSAITVGVGAASAVGAAAVVANLPSATAAMSASAATATSATSASSSGSQLQAATAPTNTTVPPVATSGAS